MPRLPETQSAASPMIFALLYSRKGWKNAPAAALSPPRRSHRKVRLPRALSYDGTKTNQTHEGGAPARTIDQNRLSPSKYSIECSLLDLTTLPVPATVHKTRCQSLPLTAAPEVFGLHDNASITRAQSDTAQLLKSVLLTESSGGGSGGADKETTINTVAADILSKVGSPRCQAKQPR